MGFNPKIELTFILRGAQNGHESLFLNKHGKKLKYTIMIL